MSYLPEELLLSQSLFAMLAHRQLYQLFAVWTLLHFKTRARDLSFNPAMV